MALGRLELFLDGNVYTGIIKKINDWTFEAKYMTVRKLSWVLSIEVRYCQLYIELLVLQRKFMQIRDVKMKKNDATRVYSVCVIR